MARYPGAIWRPLPDRTVPITPTQVILHSAVSDADSLFPYFSRSDVAVESHFYVPRDGQRVEQYVDTERQADANYKANPRAISIETWDGGDPDRTPWTPQQIEAMARLLAWLHHTHGIPLTRTTAWNSPGVGGHTDYPGVWSNVKGKTCPGMARKPQVDDVIAAARTIAEGDDMPLTVEDAQLVARILLDTHAPDHTGGKPLRVRYLLHSTLDNSAAAARDAAVARALAEESARTGRALTDDEIDRIASAVAADVDAAQAADVAAQLTITTKEN